MKKIFALIFSFINTIVFAQVGVNTTTPKAMFEIAPSSKTAPLNTDGMLVPRIDTFPATNPTIDQQGMLVYLTTTVGVNQPGFYYWDNTTTNWAEIAGDGSAKWQLTGNTVNATTDFLGSTNNADVIFKRNNLRAGRIGINNTSYGLEALKSNTTGYYNTANGVQALFSNTTGHWNTANGHNSLRNNTTGEYNTANGLLSLYSNTIGNNNTANGVLSLYSNTTGNQNTTNGFQSLSSNTTGNNNTANGLDALSSNTTGNQNTALGHSADVGSGNLTNASAIGSNAYVTTSNSLVLGSINDTNGATADVNVGIGTTAPTERLHINGKIRMVDGTQALGRVLTSDANGVASWQAAAGGSSGWQLNGNTVNATTDFLGSTNNADVIFKRNNLQAGRIGLTNTSYGIQALNPNTTGYHNTANGMNSLYSNTTGNYNTANGSQSLYFNTTGYFNTANGSQSLYFNTTGYFNTANGVNSLYSNTTGTTNTAYGFQSLYSNTTGYNNTANGTSSLFSNTTGTNNTANGRNSLYSNTTGYNNTANGRSSLYSNTTGSYNTANGFQSLFSNTTGYDNTANGMSSLLYNTTGYDNTANGYQSLSSNTTGTNNTANGVQSLFRNTIGNQNTAIGYDAGSALTTGSNNVFIGANTQPFNNTVSNYININNQIYGNNGLIGIGEANPTRAKLVVNGSVNTYNGPYGYLNGAGNAGLSNVTTANPTSIWASGRIISSEFNATSDNRIKQNVVPVQNALATLSQVSIVNYTKLSKDGATNEIGVIAQEVEKIIPQAVQQSEGDIYNATTKKWEVVQDFRTVNYQTINMITAKAVQELKTQIDLKTDEIKVINDALLIKTNEINTLKDKNNELENRLLKLEKLLEK